MNLLIRKKKHILTTLGACLMALSTIHSTHPPIYASCLSEYSLSRSAKAQFKVQNNLITQKGTEVSVLHISGGENNLFQVTLNLHNKKGIPANATHLIFSGLICFNAGNQKHALLPVFNQTPTPLKNSIHKLLRPLLSSHILNV